MRLLAFCALVVLLPAEARGQCAPPSAPDSTGDSAADVRIFARVEAGELRFNTRPRADVVPLGCAPADTVRVLVRTNIPEPVVPGATYRNIEVAVEIVTRLSVLCSPALLDLLEVNDAPRLVALCALNSPTGLNRRQP